MSVHKRYKPSLESRDVLHKIWPDRFSRFDVYWIQTNIQTDRQAKFIYRLFNKLYFSIPVNLNFNDYENGRQQFSSHYVD